MSLRAQQTSRTRSTLIIIILATIPCYCLGLVVLLVGREIQKASNLPTATPSPSNTPVVIQTLPATITPFQFPTETQTSTPTLTVTPSQTLTPFLPPTRTATQTPTMTIEPTVTSTPTEAPPTPTMTPTPESDDNP